MRFGASRSQLYDAQKTARARWDATEDVWADATRKAILGQYDDPKLFLPSLEKDLPPTIRRRLKEHRKEIDEHESFLNRRLRFEPATVEPLGVLLRVPAREVRP